MQIYQSAGLGQVSPTWPNVLDFEMYEIELILQKLKCTYYITTKDIIQLLVVQF